MKQIRLSFDVTLVAPILTHTSAAGKIGIDAACAKTADGLCYLPFSLVKGRLRQSWDELGLKDAEEWFGKRRGGWSGARGRFRFSDFVEQPSVNGPRSTPEKRCKTGESHRIRIDSRTGAADEGALQFIESPFAAGEPVTFRGDVTWFEDPASAGETRAAVLRALRWTGSFGGGRTIGFGRVDKVEEQGSDQDTEEVSTQSPAQHDDVPSYTMSIDVLDPFCLARKRIDENLFSSDSVIPGSAVRGVLATTINRLLGRDSATPILPGDATNTPWSEIADHLNEIRFSHSLPASKGSPARPVVPPVSLVRDSERKVWDIARCEGPVLIGGFAPAFAIDWKEDDSKIEDVWARLGWPDVPRTIRTRTAIDRDTKRAETGHLFSYEMIDPSDLVWIGAADFSTIDRPQRTKVVDQFERIFAMQPAALGKTKARMKIALKSANGKQSDGPGGKEMSGTAQKKQWILTLQTPSLLCDTARLDESSNRDGLFAAYASAWADLSNGALSLLRFFASQSLTGGYLSHRFGKKQFYAPFLLTDAGSVFVVEGESPAASLIEEWRASCLPLPQWVRSSYGDSWKDNPYLPCDGFGEIAVDLDHYTQPPDADPVAQWPSIVSISPLQSSPPLNGVPEVTGDTSSGQTSATVRHEDVTQGTVKAATVESRWLIAGRIQTISDFHLGSGGITFRQGLKVDDKCSKSGKGWLIEVAAVAVDKDEHAYIPGSSLKGALRAWASQRYDEKLVDSVFGGDSKDASGHAGKAEFHDAMSLEPQGSFENVPYWLMKRRTGVVASVAIDRWARTAQDKKLFHFEVVPPGVAFEVALTAQDLDEREAGLLIQALRAFGEGQSRNDNPERVALGAETNDGLGRFCWNEESVKRLANPAAWTGEWNALPALDQSVRDGLAAAAVPAGGDAPLLTVEVQIQFDGPFLVNEPSRTNKTKNDGLPNQTPRVNREGSVVLPASSFRGALRSQAERIARTIALPACHSTDPADACTPVHDAGDEENLCITCRLFGAAGWASRVRVSSFELTNKPEVYVQELVAIDRFTGGASGGAKYRARVAWCPIFSGSIHVSRDRVDEALGLLALTLRDLAQGDIQLGFGRSKGFGSCRATIPWLDTPEATAAVSSFGAAAKSPAGIGKKADSSGAPAGTPGVVATVAPVARAMDDDTFHNPYHFIPIPEHPGADYVPRSTFAHDERNRRPKDHQHRHLTHDSYAQGTYSGRVICRIATEGPLVIGAERSSSRGETPVVQGFWRDGAPHIPATTLRGMLSAIAEAASNSAVRVLADTPLSVRVHPAPRRELGTVHEYFESAFGPEILPYNPARATVSLAEQIFGFVEQEATRGVPHSDRPEDGSTNAFAGRIRVSFARATKWTKDDEKRSRVLDSPGPAHGRPVPSLYFRPRTGAGFISKDALAVGTAVPQGRKIYLHHKEPDRKTDWISGNADTPKQKNWLTPLNEAEFWFHVDFENLSRRELALICFALRPSEAFRHKLGLGKSLGLGTIRIDPAAILFVDRFRRYSRPVDAQRYSSGSLLLNELPDPYAIEEASGPAGPDDPLDAFEALRDEFARSVHPAIRRALELIGQPQYVVHPVYTPQVPGMDKEVETYKWFVENEKPGGHQFLMQIAARTPALPTLTRRTPSAIAAAGPTFKSEIVNLELDRSSRSIIARNSVSGVVEAQIPMDSQRNGVPEAARRLADGEDICARIRARREAHGYSIVEITQIETA